MRVSFILLVSLLLLPHLVAAGSTPAGGACLQLNNRVDSLTRIFQMDCDAQSYCNANSTCVPKGCRRDEYPFGYPKDASIPPMCPRGFYCPDEEDTCKQWLPPGSNCQMDRDDQCAPSSQATDDLASQSICSNSLCSSAAICLQGICRYANITIGQQCILATSVYVTKAIGADPSSVAVLRDNCDNPVSYCDADSYLCLRTRDTGVLCLADRECTSGRCVDERCVDSLETAFVIPIWQYVLTGVCMLLGSCSTIVLLVTVHKRQKYRRLLKVQVYYAEQMRYRNAIFAATDIYKSRM